MYIGCDFAKPGSEATVSIETRDPRSMFWVDAPTGAELVKKIKEKGNRQP